MPLSALSSVYEHVNEQGIVQYYAVAKVDRYNPVRTTVLAGAGLFQKISSSMLYYSSAADTTLILFSYPSWDLNQFSGPYRQLTNARAGRELSFNLTDVNFNDATTALMLVAANRAGEIRVSFRDMMLDEWNRMLDTKLRDGARRDGDPVLTWEMFPEGVSGLDRNLIYLKIYQRLRIEINWWPDYSASIGYWIRLFLDQDRHLRGHVVRWSCWVERGTKQGQIEARLCPQVESGANDLEIQLQQRLEPLAEFTFSDLYYLPGRQLTPAPSGVTSGWTTDDITIVVEV